MIKRQNKIKFWVKSGAKALIFALLATLLIALVCGYKIILINGWSAEPYIKIQSLAITQKCDPNSLQVGDFVTFTQSGKNYVTHQVVSIDRENEQIICRGWQGDASLGEYNMQDDIQILTYKNFVGKVVFTSYPLGSTLFVLKQNPLIAIGLLGLVVLIFIVKNQQPEVPEFN